MTKLSFLIAVTATLLAGAGTSAAQAETDALTAHACSGFTVSGISCSVGSSVLAHCPADGRRCRRDGLTWRCNPIAGGGRRCVSGRRAVARVPAAPPVPAFQSVYLDTLPRTGGEEVTPGEVSINGVSYADGIQMEVGWAMSDVEATYSIPRGAHTFSAVIGNDDNQTNELWAEIPLLFEVFVDGRRMATAHAEGHTTEPLANISVAGGDTIKLVVINVGDALGGTRADWGDPLFS